MEGKTIELEYPSGKAVTISVDENTRVSDVRQQIDLDPHFETVFVSDGELLMPHARVIEHRGVRAFEKRVLPKDSIGFGGFGALAERGFSRARIALVRERFHEKMHSQHMSREDKLRLEEEWLPVIIDGGDPLGFLKVGLLQVALLFAGGFVAGILLGFISLIVIILVQRKKSLTYGLLTGMIANLFIRSLFHYIPV